MGRLSLGRRMDVRLGVSELDLPLRRRFVISSGATDRATTLAARVELEGGSTGWGEAAPSQRVTGEGLAEARAALEGWSKDPKALGVALAQAEFEPGRGPTPAARCAASVAHLDACGRAAGVPLRRLLNLPEGEVPSSITLSIGKPEEVVAEAAIRDREGWRIFKVKLGGAQDLETMHALRDRFPEKALRVDANEGWTPDTARHHIAALERMGVELVEQPLPRDRVVESAELARTFDVPIILDEPALDSEALLRLVQADAADGVNIKLAKCGGPFEARRMVKILRDHEWKVMLGCMLESSLGIAAASAFAGTLDFADLDSHHLIAGDPFEGLDAPVGLVRTPGGDGVGVLPRATATPR